MMKGGWIPDAGRHALDLLSRIKALRIEFKDAPSLAMALMDVLGCDTCGVLVEVQPGEYKATHVSGPVHPRGSIKCQWLTDLESGQAPPITTSAENSDLKWCGIWILGVKLDGPHRRVVLCGRGDKLFVSYDVNVAKLIVSAASQCATEARVFSALRQAHSSLLTVFGKDSGDGLIRLRQIAARLEESGYDPVLLKDIPDVASQSLEEKAVFWAVVSRFVIVEDSTPTGHLIELRDLTVNRIVTVVLRERGKASTFMVKGIEEDFRFVKELEYDAKSLKDAVRKANTWAEATIQRRTSRFNNEYRSWRP
jgi:hypothetical protein